MCHKRCKSGCGSDLASYSHCTLDTSVSNGSTSNEDCIYRLVTRYRYGSKCFNELDILAKCIFNQYGSESGVCKNWNGNVSYFYRYRAVYDVIEMPWDWPVDVNYHEAKAYCTWKGADYRLPTEGEYYRMRNEEVRINQKP